MNDNDDRLLLGGCIVHLHGDRVRTVLPSGHVIASTPFAHASSNLKADAQAAGYGDDVARFIRTHEVAHSLLAHWMGEVMSSSFARLANGKPDWAADRVEEVALMSLERYANARGIDLIELAREASLAP